MSNIAYIDGQNLYMGTRSCDPFNKVVLISGDGDYKMLVDFLIEENKFEKVLFPNRKYASSLYKKLGRKYFAHLEDEDVKKKIALQAKKRGP